MSVAYPRYRAWHTFLLWCAVLLGGVPLQAQVLPLEQKNAINGDWLVLDETTSQLVPYVANMHNSYTAVHQWVDINPRQPFLIGFTAKKDLCLFLNNQLVFTADSNAAYTLNMATYAKGIQPAAGKFLFTAWHPNQQPFISTYKNEVQQQQPGNEERPRPASLTIRARDYVNQNAFIVFMLLIGLIYGSLRVNFTSDFHSVFKLSQFTRTNYLEEGFFAKPIGSWSSILFILAFSLSIALLIVAIHTNVQQVQLLNRLFPVSEADIITKILFYTLLVFSFVLLKYLFLKVMAFIFGLEQVVTLQYSEFIRTILFLGIFLPLVMLLYLSFNTVFPGTVLLVSSLTVMLLLVLTTFRVFVTVNKKVAVLNLHLFSYLCATEIIPLAIILKLIVFNY